MIFDEELFTRNIILIQDIFAENGMRAISHFQNLGLKGNKIVWNIGEAILRSGKKNNWSLVDVKEYDI